MQWEKSNFKFDNSKLEFLVTFFGYYLKWIKITIRRVGNNEYFFKKGEPSDFDVLCHLEGPKNESRCEFVKLGLKCSHVFM